MMVVRCASCGASIVWARTKAGHRVPINAAPAECRTWMTGPRVTLTERLGESPLATLDSAGLYTPHRDTCEHPPAYPRWAIDRSAA